MILQGKLPESTVDEDLCKPCAKKTSKSRGSKGFNSAHKRTGTQEGDLKPLPTNAEISEFLQSKRGCCAIASGPRNAKRCCLANYFTIANESCRQQVCDI